MICTLIPYLPCFHDSVTEYILLRKDNFLYEIIQTETSFSHRVLTDRKHDLTLGDKNSSFRYQNESSRLTFGKMDVENKKAFRNFFAILLILF